MSRCACAAALSLFLLFAWTSPAAAHGAASDDAPASNYRSRVTDHPTVDGVELRVIEAGARVELVNRSDDEVVVEGYDGEPYLRVGPDGVLENSNSPAAYLNQSRDADVLPPAGVGDGPPQWRRISGESSVRWHDHRAHWMGGDPPLVRERPGEQHTISEWDVPLRVGDRTVTVSGILEWAPGPSPLPWFALIAAIGAVFAACVVRRRVLAVIVAAFAATTAASALITVGAWQTSAEAALGKLPMLALPALVATLLLGAWSLARTRPSDALVLAAGAAATAGITSALTSGDWLVRSQLPTALPDQLGRVAVASIIGTGAGLLIGAVWVTAAPFLGRSPERPGVAERETVSEDREPSEPLGSEKQAGSTTAPHSDVPLGRATNEESDGDAVTAESDDVADVSSAEFSKFRSRIFVALGVTIAGVLTIAQLTGGDDEPPSSPDEVAVALGEICAAVTSASSNGGVALRAAFEGPAHDALHTFAADVEAKDRATAGTLLRAKQKIEATIAEPGDVPAPGPELADAIRAASDVLGEPAPQACTEDET